MRRLIINADDLGMSCEVNKQIEDCIRLGCITSSTLMANAPAFDGGVRIAKQYPQISVGVHLNIIEFAPLTNQSIFKKHGLLNSEGNFIEGAISVVPIADELKQAVFEEWDAQICKVKYAGINPSHCDSHEHTHTIRQLNDVLCRVLDKHNIHRVRRIIVPSIRLLLRERKNSVVQYDKSSAMQPPRQNVVLRRLNFFRLKYLCWQWNKSMMSKYLMADAFYSFRDFYNNIDVLNLGDRSSVIELMCHPGSPIFQKETEYLMQCDRWNKDNYSLISYLNL